jgi:hypothetical protein
MWLLVSGFGVEDNLDSCVLHFPRQVIQVNVGASLYFDLKFSQLEFEIHKLTWPDLPDAEKDAICQQVVGGGEISPIPASPAGPKRPLDRDVVSGDGDAGLPLEGAIGSPTFFEGSFGFVRV